ncbi:MAG: hypothetical protein LUH22_03185 [Bacteroides sp.]|nr:hypothetical protein [Bacteroides sp.]
MIKIENLPLESWINELKPYQKNIIIQLVSNFGEEKAAEEWISSRGPIQTATFGGDTSNIPDSKTYWNRLKEEFDKLVCGHPDYKKEQEKFATAGKAIGTGAVASISNWLAPIVGMSPSILIPAVILLLYTTAKIGVKAYCSTKNYKS